LVDANGVLIQDEAAIQVLASQFYENLFNQDSYSSTFPKLVVKKVLTMEAQQWLIRPVSK